MRFHGMMQNEVDVNMIQAIKSPLTFRSAGLFVTRQRPTFPLPHSSSIIGLGGLNFRVRDGNGCGPSGNATGNVYKLNMS